MYVQEYNILYLFKGSLLKPQKKECQATGANVYEEKWNENKGCGGKSQQCLNGFELNPHYNATIHKFRSKSF